MERSQLPPGSLEKKRGSVVCYDFKHLLESLEHASHAQVAADGDM